MNISKKNDQTIKIRVLNQLFVVQSMIHVFTDETELGNFVMQSVKMIPGIEKCFFCTRHSKFKIGAIPNEFKTLNKYLNNIPNTSDKFSFVLSEKKNLSVFSLQTYERDYGYCFVYINEVDIFKEFEASLNNFFNVIAIELENRWQKVELYKNKEQLEDMIEKRTVELQAEITEHRLAEVKLKNEKQFLEAVFDSISEGIVACNADGILTRFNKATKEFHGLPKEAIPAKEWAKHYNLYHPDGKTLMEKKDVPLFKALKDGEVKNAEMMIRSKNGNERLLVSNGQTLKDANGNILGAVVAMHDITERKKADDMLRESENHFRGLFNNSISGVALHQIVVNDEGEPIDYIFLMANQAFETHTGLHLANILGKHVTQIIPGIEKTNLPKIYGKVALTGEPTSFETYVEPLQRYFNISAYQVGHGKFAAIFDDITERKKAEEALKRSENLLNQTQRITKLGGWEYDVGTNQTYFSDEVFNIYGIDDEKMFAPEEGIKFYHPDDRPMVMDSFTKAITNAEPYDLAVRFINARGENLWVRTAGKPILENGKVVRVFGSLMDITELKSTEKKLKKLNDFIINTLENMTDGYVSLNNNWEYTYVNKKAGEMFDRDPQSLFGKNIWTEFPEGVDQPFYKNYYKAVANQKSIIFEDYYTPFNQWYENRIVPSKDGLAIFFQNITERKTAENSLQNYADRLNLLHSIDKDILASKSPKIIATNVLIKLKKIIPYKLGVVGIYNDVNKTITRIAMNATFDVKVKSDGNPVPISYYDFADFDLLIKGDMQIIKDLKNKKIKSDFFKELVDHNIDFIIIIPLMVEGKPIGILNLSVESEEDFTSDKIEIATEIASQLAISIQQWELREEVTKYTEDLEEKIAVRTAQLEYTNKELNDFSQIVSHDLKAPLRAISQLSYWLSQDYADKIDKEGQEQLKMLVGRAKRLNSLIEGVLQYSRASKSAEKKDDINLNMLVNEVITLLDPSPNIKITIKNKLPNYIGDPTRIGQLFQNLIGNAIKYNDKPKGEIYIGCKTKNDIYEFYVSDNGIGIEAKYFERIFTIFQRLEARDKQEGTGIGLSLVKRIVQIYGGKIWLESKLGEGSTFFFTLPIINRLTKKK